MTTSHQFGINNGPSREALFDALRLQAEGRKVTFEIMAAAPWATLKMPIETSFRVQSLGIEDGSGESWLLILTHDEGEKGLFGSQYLKAHYRTDNRTGWIRPA